MLRERSIEARIEDIERQLRNLRAAQLPSSSLGSGGLTVRDGGKITFLDPAGDVLVTLDENGLSVGTDVIVDENGLEVIGGLVTPVWPFQDYEQTDDFSLDTTFREVNEIVIDPPSWVQVLQITCSHFLSVIDTPPPTVSCFTQLRVNGTITPPSGRVDIPSGLVTDHVNVTRNVQVTSASFPVTIHQYGQVTSGTNANNLFALSVSATGVRTG